MGKITSETAALKLELEEKRVGIRQKHERGADGFEVCRELCLVVDEAITRMFESHRSNFTGALVAIGGYGRGFLNPCSDIDLLFLIRETSRSAPPPLPSSMLARLWDLGLKVGHSARSIDDTVAMGLSDLTARTAMMESRFLAGSRELFDEFRKKYARKVIHYKPYSFIDAKLEEMRRRHAAHGLVTHLTEPNLKESRGGLRDIHSAMWLIRSKVDVSTPEDMAERGLMNPSELDMVNGAYSKLLRLRNALHWRACKLSDRLIQSLQPDIARAEGYEGSDNEVAAELMREYYKAAEIVDRFATETIALALEYKRKRPWRLINIDKDGLFTDGVTLRASSFPPDDLGEKPALLFRIARRLSEEKLKPAPNLWRGLKRISEKAPACWFEGEEAGRLLLAILRLRDSARAISVLHETGVLERFIPEFAGITRLTQFDLFHKYTADEHTINTLRKLEGTLENDYVGWRLREIFRSQEDIEVIKLALLLHDLGKRAEDRHAIEEDTRTPVILKRLGLERLIEPIGFLVRRHLLMSRTAQHLDFAVPTTLRHFCEQVGSRENLRRLYLLTYADIAGVGPEVWNDWKDNLLSDLFEKAEKYYMEGEAVFLSADKQIESLARQVALSAKRTVDERTARSFLERAPDRYLRNADMEAVVEDIRLVESLKGRKLAISYRANAGDATGKITLAAQERLGFFSIIAGALAAKNISVVEAQIHTFEGRLALDTITVTGQNLSLFSDPESLSSFEEELVLLLDGKKNVQEMVERRTKYMRPPATPGAPSLEPRVIILNHLSKSNTVLEVWAPDRVGLLYDITRTLASLGLNINSAKIGTEGMKAINVFYVTTEEGGKVEDGGHERKIAETMLFAINNPFKTA